jgi:hypothetical protein
MKSQKNMISATLHRLIVDNLIETLKQDLKHCKFEGAIHSLTAIKVALLGIVT